VLVLLTDGDNTTGALEPLQAAALAAKSEIRIYTIGLGGRVGDVGAGGFELGRDASDLNPRLLRAIASMTGGHYFLASDAPELSAVYAALDRLEPSARDSRTYRPATELYPWPAGAALVLSALIAGLLVLRRDALATRAGPNSLGTGD
jgi:Ca-activated chloride channel family protein